MPDCVTQTTGQQGLETGEISVGCIHQGRIWLVLWKDWLDLDHYRGEGKAPQAAGRAKASSEAEMSCKCHGMP